MGPPVTESEQAPGEVAQEPVHLSALAVRVTEAPGQPEGRAPGPVSRLGRSCGV